jgi:class 3 adenylate cyclase
MADDPFTENDFLQKITEVIEENLPDEQFGVSELAREMGMSRSSLLRKVKKETQLSVSQFIRDLRLKRAMDMLKDTSETVSEISYQVGFKSSSYFIKCFREHYGYPPGEAEKRDFDQSKAPSTTQSHRLVAIMFTDIQGYTALMQQDEGKALQFRNRHREVFDSITPKHRGKILQYYGDGTLSIFQSAIDAVKCGIEIQRALRMAPQIPVRIGIHSGDLIVDKEDVIGDGVNVASRVESLAAAGSVFISGKIYDEVKNQTGIQTASMGHFEFKNVSKPMEVFAVTNPGLVVPEKDQLTGKLKRPSPQIKELTPRFQGQKVC